MYLMRSSTVKFIIITSAEKRPLLVIGLPQKIATTSGRAVLLSIFTRLLVRLVGGLLTLCLPVHGRLSRLSIWRLHCSFEDVLTSSFLFLY